MESQAFKYSQFFINDGGLDKVRSDVKLLSADVVKEAEKMKAALKTAFKNNDTQGIGKLENEISGLIKKQQQLESVIKKLNEQRKKTPKAITAETEALKKNRAEARQVAKIQNTTRGSIENVRAKLGLVTTAWTKLSAAELENTKRGRRLVQSKKAITTELKRLEKATGDNRREVGNYGLATSKLRGGLVSLAGAAGVTFGVFGAFRLFKSSITIVKDFEKANATLGGILNATAEEARVLNEDAKRLGETTVKSATEVVALQTAYARLGFSTQDIINLTEATISGSIAMNAELADVANLVGAVVNSFDDLSTSDADHVIEVLTAATTKSALSFEKLNTALPIVAGAANAVGVPLERTVAILGKLSDSGIDASSSSTALRNVFIESAKRGINYEEAIKKISTSTDKLTTANAIFGKRAAVSALVIANNTDAVAELTEELENAAVVQQLVDRELNTLDGSLKLLESAWEGMILSMNDATDTGNVLTGSIRFLAENLNTILKTVAIAGATWLAYAATIKATAAATKAGIVIDRGATIATNFKTIATKAATAAQAAFNTALKANPIGLIVALLAAAVTAYLAFGGAVDYAVEQQKKLNDVRKQTNASESEVVKVEAKNANKRIQLLAQQIAVRRAGGEDAKKLDKELIEGKRLILNEEVAANQKIIDDNIETNKKLETTLEARLKSINDHTKMATGSIRAGTGETQAAFRDRLQKSLNEENLLYKSQITNRDEINKVRIAKIAALNDEIAKLDDALVVQITANGEKLKKENLKRAKELELLLRRLQDLQDGFTKDEELKIIKQINRKFNREIEAIKGNSKVEIDLRKALEKEKNIQLDKVRKDFREKSFAEFDKAAVLERNFIKNEAENRIFEEDLKHTKILEAIEKNTSLSTEKRIEFTKRETERYLRAVSRIELDAALEQIERTKLIEEARVEQERGRFKTQEDFEKFKAARLKEILFTALTERLELLEAFGGDEFKVEIEQIKGQLAALANEIKPPKTDKWKKFGETIKSVMLQVAEEIERTLQAAVKAAESSVNEQQTQVDKQRARAEAGLLNTLAFEQRELRKRESEVIKQQKRLERVQKVKALYSSYTANSSQGDGKGALTKTLRDFAILEAISASFGDGGVVEDRLPGNGIFQGQSHQGNKKGIPILVEGKEGIFSASEMNNLGKDNFYKMKEMAGMGKMTPGFFSKQRKSIERPVAVASSNHQLINEVAKMRKAFANRPHEKLDVEGLVSGAMKFTHSITEKGKTINNKYIVKKNRF